MTKCLPVLLLLTAFNSYSQTNFVPVTYGTSAYNPQEMFFGGPEETYFLGNCWVRGSTSNEIYWSGYCYTPNNLHGGASPLLANTFAVGKNGTIWKHESCDLFGNWHQQTSGVTDTLYSVKFFTIDTGFVCGGNGTILRTFNNGRNWSIMPTGITETLRRLIYTPDRKLFAIGDNGMLITSTDNASTWNVIATGTNEALTDISFAGNDTGYISGYNGTLLKSVDAGQTWNPLNSGTTAKISSVDFVTGLRGFIGSDSVRMTTDGGMTFTPYPKYLYTPIIDIKFRDMLNGYFLTSDALYRTYDGGQSWFNFGQDLQTVEFPTKLIGYAAGFDVLRKTTDGGLTWSQIHPFNGSTIYDAFFLNTDTGYVSGTSGSIYKTTDAGSTWTKQVTNTNALLRSIHFFNADDGIAVGSNWTTVKTNDGGQNWSLTSTPNPSVYGYHDLYFLDNNLGYRCGSQGSIHKTTDGGATWTSLTSGTTDYLLKIYFIDMMKGFAIGESGTMLRTVNGGVSWTPYNLPVSSFLNAIAFSDSLHGYIGGESGVFFETNDGGVTWVYKSFNAGNIYDITFTDAYNGYLVGSGDFRAIFSPVKGLNAYAPMCHGSGTVRPLVADNVTIDSGNVFLMEMDTTGSDFTDAFVIGAALSDTSGPNLYFKVPADIKGGKYSSRIRTTRTSPVSESVITLTKVQDDPDAAITVSNDTLFTIYNPEYLYQWYEGFNIIPGATFHYLALDSGGNYRVIVKHGCCLDANAYITVSDCNGAFVTAPAVQDAFVCDSTSATLTVSGAAQYAWYDSDTSVTVLSTDSFYITSPITATTTYYVAGVYPNCKTDRIPVRAYVVGSPQLPSALPVTACANNGVYLFSSGASLNWYIDTTSAPVATNSTYYFHVNASIPVYVTSFNYSCESNFVSVNINIVSSPTPQVISGDSLVAPGSMATYFYVPSPGNSIEWNVTGGTYIDLGDSIIVTWGAAGAGIVEVVETNAQDCASIPATYAVDIDMIHSTNSYQNDIFNIYPNPANEYLVIENKSTYNGVVVLYNSLLQPVLQQELKLGETARYDISVVSEGIYIYRISFENDDSYSGKLIITD